MLGTSPQDPCPCPQKGGHGHQAREPCAASAAERDGWAPCWLGRLCDCPHQHEVWMKRQEALVPEARPRPGTRKCSRVKAPRWWGTGPVHPGPGG